MTSVVAFGTTDRITVRKCFNAPRAGSGTPARYSSTFFAATLPFIQVRLPHLSLMSCHSEPILVMPSAVEEPAVRREPTWSGSAAKGEQSRPRANGCLHHYTAKLKWIAISLD